MGSRLISGTSMNKIIEITTPSNFGSIAFHRSLGMQLLGEPSTDGIPIVPNYAGRGVSRVVFWKSI